VESLSESMSPQENTQSWDVQAAFSRNIPIGSVMWLGQLDDLPIGNKVPTTGLHEVIKCTLVCKDVKGRNSRYEGGLMRLKGKLPAFVQ
jgi:hypothetical protein